MNTVVGLNGASQHVNTAVGSDGALDIVWRTLTGSLMILRFRMRCYGLLRSNDPPGKKVGVRVAMKVGMKVGMQAGVKAGMKVGMKVGMKSGMKAVLKIGMKPWDQMVH